MALIDTEMATAAGALVVRSSEGQMLLGADRNSGGASRLFVHNNIACHIGR